jgi:large subunit ribosomal protein L29
MAIFRVDELRNMSPEELVEELDTLKSELIRERGLVVSGGAPENPGRIKEIKRSIARIKTITKERAIA